MDINLALETLPAKIAEFTEKENEAYARMLNSHEEYKRTRAKIFLEVKASDHVMSLKQLDYQLDASETLCKIKDQELLAEIDYRAARLKKDFYDNEFQAAMERGRNLRKEMSSLNDTIKR